MVADHWGIAVASLLGAAFVLAAIVALVMRKWPLAGYLAATGYVLLWPVHLWFSQFGLAGRVPPGTGYIWNGVFQILVPVIYLVASCFLGRFRPVVTALLLAYVFSLLLQLFSYIYWSYGTARNFSVSLSHLDSFYFALGTLTTAGTGNISAISETARGIQTLQMGLDLAFVGFAVALVLARYSNHLSRRGVPPSSDGTATAATTLVAASTQPRQVREPDRSNRTQQPGKDAGPAPSPGDAGTGKTGALEG